MNRDYRIGERIQGRWLVHDVKRGGMGIVYVVHDPVLRQAFAVKTLPARIRREAIDRFREEALLWIRLAPHAHIAEARFVEVVDDRPLLFLEYVSGGHLGRWVGTPRLGEDLPRVLRFAIELCDAMVHARAEGVAAHRDLKPQNCLITADEKLKLTDFGLARVAEAARGARRRGGTIEYMAPEQWLDFDAADERSDIYSFGILLAEMLTGRLPFGGRPDVDDRELERRHRSAVPPPVGRGLDEVVAACLAKAPGDRFASFVELRARLDAVHATTTGETVPLPPRGSDLDARQWNARGASLRALGHGEDALACYERALEIEPSLAHAWSNKAEVLFSGGDPRAAMACFDHVSASGEDEHVLANRSAIALHLGDAEAALVAADRSIARNPRLAIAWNNRGAALAALGRATEAVDAYERARGLDPGLDLAWLNEGVALGALGRTDAEIERYDRAIHANPRSAPAWCNRGAALAARGDWTEALRCYRRALRIDPSYADAWFNLGDALAEVGRLSGAARAYGRFTELRPEDAEGWTRSAIVLERLGRRRKADACRARVVELGRRQSA